MKSSDPELETNVKDETKTIEVNQNQQKSLTTVTLEAESTEKNGRTRRTGTVAGCDRSNSG